MRSLSKAAIAPRFKLLHSGYGGLVRDPIEHATRWPGVVVAGLIVAGLISPLICFAGAAVAYALTDRDQGTILTGAGLAHLVLGFTLLGGV